MSGEERGKRQTDARTRRDFLKATLGAAGGLVVGCQNVTTTPSTTPSDPTVPGGNLPPGDVPPGNVPPGDIDAHVHVWTADLERYPLKPDFRPEFMRPPTFTSRELFAQTRANDVGRVVLIQMSFYGYDNSYMLDTMEAHPGVFSSVAVIDAENKPRETMLALKERGVRGFRIQPRNRSDLGWLERGGMAEMWKVGAEAGLSLCALLNPEFLPSVDVMCEKFPRTRVVIDHFGRVGIDGEIRSRDLDRLCALSRHDNVYVKVSAFYALGAKRTPYHDLIPMIDRVVKCFGPQRLMWASDCPFQVLPGHSYAASIGLIREGVASLSQDDRQWILRRTAERVFFS